MSYPKKVHELATRMICWTPKEFAEAYIRNDTRPTLELLLEAAVDASWCREADSIDPGSSSPTGAMLRCASEFRL